MKILRVTTKGGVQGQQAASVGSSMRSPAYMPAQTPGTPNESGAGSAAVSQTATGRKREREDDVASATSDAKKVKSENTTSDVKKVESGKDTRVIRAEEVKPVVVVKPSAFANLLACGTDAASQSKQPKPRALESLGSFSFEAPPQTSSHVKGLPPCVYVDNNGDAAAFVYRSDDAGYSLPGAEMTRRIFEEDEAAEGIVKTTELFRLWEEVASSFE